MRPGFLNGNDESTINVSKFQFTGEDIYVRSSNYSSIVRISGSTGQSTRLVQFEGLGDGTFPGTPAADGRSMIVGRPDGWYLCSIPETPGLSEQLDFLPKEDVEYTGTVNEPPIAYEGYILWKSRIYDTTTGVGTPLWPEYDIDAPDGHHTVLGASVYGHRSDPYPIGGPNEIKQTHLYRVALPDGPPQLLTTLPYETGGLRAHANTGALVGSVAPVDPAQPNFLIVSVDAQSGTPTTIGAFDYGDGPHGETVVGDDLYFVRRNTSPGCLVRLPLVP